MELISRMIFGISLLITVLVGISVFVILKILTVSALIKQAKKMPDELYKSLTWVRGNEMSDHRRFTMATDMDVYFCDPQSPWQRGSNENTNRLLRQYFPKGTGLSVHSQAKLNAVARRLNERPRKTLCFKCPQKDLTPVLHRSVELATQSSSSISPNITAIRSYSA